MKAPVCPICNKETKLLYIDKYIKINSKYYYLDDSVYYCDSCNIELCSVEQISKIQQFIKSKMS